VHSLGGRLVFGKNVEIRPGNNLFYVQINDLPPATYFVRLEHGMTGRGETAKIVKF
jgi:hypothetical protein